MKRLTERDQYSQDCKIQAKNLDYHCVAKDKRGYVTYYGEHIDKLAEYEDLEEQGLLLRLHCKIGDKMYVYDIDKVIAKLEELDVKSITRYKNGNFGDFDGIEYYIKKRKAIEIVKQGIVSDDVCEWSYDKHFEFAKSECGSMDTHRIEFKKLKYCPYCGKRIKVVE